MLGRMQTVEGQLARSRIIIGRLNWIQQSINGAIVGKIGLLTTNNPRYNDFYKHRRDLSANFDALQKLFERDLVQSARLTKLKMQTLHLFEELEKAGDNGSSDSIKELMNSSAILRITTDIPKLRGEILAAERQHDNLEPQDLSESRANIRYWLDWFVLLDILIVVGVVAYFMKDIANRLAIMSENALYVVLQKPLHPPLPGNDEISRLDHAFHAMADQILEMTQRERSIAENAVDVICSIDEDGRFSAVNKATLATWGYPSEELTGSRYANIIEPSELERMKNFLKEAHTGQGIRFDTVVVCKDGRLADTRCAVMWSKERRMYFCVMHDISEQKQIEKLKQQFVAMISHDLRSPLTTIIGYFEVLHAGTFGVTHERLERMSKSAANAASRMLSLVDQLLSIEKLESGTLELEPKKTALHAIAQSCVDVTRDVAAQRRMKIEVVPFSIEITIDPDRMSQVISNLLTNAIKYSPDDSTIVVSAVASDSYAELSVADKGRGIQKDQQAAIFERFKQVDRSDAKRGTGLGLAICRSIVELHHGQIGVESEVGKGSRFWVRLPLDSVSNEPRVEPGNEAVVASGNETGVEAGNETRAETENESGTRSDAPQSIKLSSEVEVAQEI